MSSDRSGDAVSHVVPWVVVVASALLILGLFITAVGGVV